MTRNRSVEELKRELKKAECVLADTRFREKDPHVIETCKHRVYRLRDELQLATWREQKNGAG